MILGNITKHYSAFGFFTFQWWGDEMQRLKNVYIDNFNNVASFLDAAIAIQIHTNRLLKMIKSLVPDWCWHGQPQKIPTRHGKVVFSFEDMNESLVIFCDLSLNLGAIQHDGTHHERKLAKTFSFLAFYQHLRCVWLFNYA